MDLNQNNEVQAYLRKVFAQVKFRDAHQELGLELQEHIQEVAEEHMAQGALEETAVAQAISQMGDADIIGKQLNKIHKPRPDWSILLLSMLFISIGLLVLYFIQKQSLLEYDLQLFERSILFSAVSLFFVITFYFFDYRKLERYSKYIYIGTFLLLLFTTQWGMEFYGSKRWIALGPFSINIVAISPLFFGVAFAGIFRNWDWSSNFKLLQGCAIAIAPLILILLSPSISTGAIYAVACVVIMIASGASYKKMILLSSPFITILALSIITKPFRLQRLFTFLNPQADPTGSGYQSIQLHKMIGSSGLWGQGLTLDAQALPEIHTDFVFTFITYTFGWVASTLLIVFIILFLVRITQVNKKVKNQYAKLLLHGFVAILAVEFIWNIAMNLGLAPISCLGLPFISYGGSQLIMNGAIIGIISSIYRRKNLSELSLT